MTNLEDYKILNDGAGTQAQFTLHELQNNLPKSRSIGIDRWDNCREQGYILSLVKRNDSQLNICFFEHRNTDQVCAVRWEQRSEEPITIDTADFGDVYTDKYDVSISLPAGSYTEMAKWIRSQFNKF